MKSVAHSSYLILMAFLNIIDPSTAGCYDALEEGTWVESKDKSLLLVMTGDLKDSMNCTVQYYNTEDSQNNFNWMDLIKTCNINSTNVNPECQGKPKEEVPVFHFVCFLAKAMDLDLKGCGDYEKVRSIYWRMPLQNSKPPLSKTSSLSGAPSPSTTLSPSSAPSLSKEPPLSITPSPSTAPLPFVAPSPSVAPSLSTEPPLSKTSSPSVAPSLSTTPSPFVAPSPSVAPSLSTEPPLSKTSSLSVAPSLSKEPLLSITPSPSTAPLPFVAPSPSVAPSLSTEPPLSKTSSLSGAPSPSTTLSPSLAPSLSTEPPLSKTSSLSVAPSLSKEPPLSITQSPSTAPLPSTGPLPSVTPSPTMAFQPKTIGTATASTSADHTGYNDSKNAGENCTDEGGNCKNPCNPEMLTTEQNDIVWRNLLAISGSLNVLLPVLVWLWMRRKVKMHTEQKVPKDDVL